MQFKTCSQLQVEKYWAEKGLSGFTVFKYRLSPFIIRSNVILLKMIALVHFSHGRFPKCTSEIRGLVCEDISGGQENVPIPATNLVDDPPVAPTGKLNSLICSQTILHVNCSLILFDKLSPGCLSTFAVGRGPFEGLQILICYEYFKSMKVARNLQLPANAAGCDCEGLCRDPKTCSCARLNGSDFPYVHLGGGRLDEAKHVVFECGPNCGCGPECVNRTSQRELKYQLEVFRTPKKGWAVRSWDFIPAGAPRRQQDASVSVIQNMDKIDEQRSESMPEFCIDAASIGNVARFINHISDNIPPLQVIPPFMVCISTIEISQEVVRYQSLDFIVELTYDYGYTLDSVHGPDGKVIQMPCYCGAECYRKRLF
ncbi:Detected protein of unknown function [Hibiscus syriacus]|uniref:Histone-lysine N-methyltransferase, H3 lysine-9 specific SUVH4 n=1 Tax=Hibiscus syriacus TaxID=106335 RepID=A0A6A2ZUW7_HIBSY|nr:Detected protein of unknown function [Hibiscus syriacus]